MELTYTHIKHSHTHELIQFYYITAAHHRCADGLKRARVRLTHTHTKHVQALTHARPNSIFLYNSGRIITALMDSSVRVWEPNPVTDELVERALAAKFHSDVIECFEYLPFGCFASYALRHFFLLYSQFLTSYHLFFKTVTSHSFSFA